MDYQNTLTPEFCELVQRIEDSGLNAEVIAEALNTMQKPPTRFSNALLTNCSL
jgi:hypothetical protein